MNSKKTLTLPVVVTFVGDYYDADEITGVTQGWIEAALNDRDDVEIVDFGEAEIAEVPIDG